MTAVTGVTGESGTGRAPGAAGGMVWLVARREVTSRIRERAFLVSTGITLLIVLAVVLVPRLVGSGHASFRVALAGTGRNPIGPALAAAGRPAGVGVHTRTYPDAAAARAAVRTGDADAALLNGDTVVSDGDLDGDLAAVLDRAHQAVATRQRLRDRGISPTAVAQALDVPPLRQVTLAGDADHSARRGVALVGVIILFGQLIGYGNWVAFGVVEEKSSRVVELLLAAVRPWQLLAGKILGIGALALGQLVLISGVGLAAAVGGGSVRLSLVTLGIVGQVFAWFVLGYAFYSSAYAAAASRVSRQEELNNVTGPMTLVLMVSYFIAIYAAQHPTGVLARVASLVPPFSAMTMPTRTAVGRADGWQVGLAIGLMVVATVLLVRLSGRIYANTILRTGARVRLSEALRAREPAVT
ncbi:MAG TPA: ABC transporter permease [Mycobacteriales bacterium]|nr:ABC transporter permease [Mycobacteriales bacterium]